MKNWLIRSARGSALTMLAEVFARAANTLFFVLLTWYLGEQEASVYTLGFTFSTFLLPFSLAGLEQLLSREVAREPERGGVVLGNFLLVRTLSSLLCYGALILWLSGPYGFDGSINTVVLVLGATLIPDSLISLCQSYLITHERTGYIALIGGVTGGVKLVLGTGILMLGGGALAAALVVLVTSVIALLLFLGLICARFELPAFSFDRAFWLVQMRAEIPLLLIGIMLTVEGSLDALLLSRSGDPLHIGVFAAAAAVLNALLLFPQVLRQVILPLMTSAYKAAQQQAYEIYLHSQRFLLIIGLAIAVSLMLTADISLPKLYHDHFLATIPVFQIIIWSFVFTLLAVPNGRLMLVVGRQSASVPIQLVAMLLNVALNFILQPTLDARGAAWARVASTGLALALSVYYVQRHIYRWNMLPIFAAPLGAAAAFALTVVSLRWWGTHWLLALAAGWLVYGAVLYALRGISAAELRGMLTLVRRSADQRIMKRSL